MDVQSDVINLLERTLGIKGRSLVFEPGTRLMGNIPELDSMAVATVITSLEDHFGFVIEDDEIDGSTFATLRSLVDFVEGKLAA